MSRENGITNTQGPVIAGDSCQLCADPIPATPTDMGCGGALSLPAGWTRARSLPSLQPSEMGGVNISQVHATVRARLPGWEHPAYKLWSFFNGLLVCSTVPPHHSFGLWYCPLYYTPLSKTLDPHYFMTGPLGFSGTGIHCQCGWRSCVPSYCLAWATPKTLFKQGNRKKRHTAGHRSPRTHIFMISPLLGPGGFELVYN